MVVDGGTLCNGTTAADTIRVLRRRCAIRRFHMSRLRTSIHFVSVDILAGEKHYNARHDLESFFYVLIHPFRPMGIERYLCTICSIKQAYMSEEGFRRKLLPSLDPAMRAHLEPVLLGWRRTLFGGRAPGGERPGMYDDMLAVLDRQVEELASAAV